MPFIITNEQTALRQEPGRIYRTSRAYCDTKGEWTITRKAKTFATRDKAAAYLAKGGLTEGRHEDPGNNRLNIIAIEEVK